MPIVVSAIETPSIFFEEQTGHNDGIENRADKIVAPSILSSGAVAAVVREQPDTGVIAG
jgi:hypothetical protein